jgi:hypothetical protein
MTTGLDDARDLIAACRAANPGVVDLAEAVCLAVRVEPLLLRRARLRLCPRVEAGAESRLWFSPLVGSRSTAAIVLDGDIRAALRETLADRPPGWLDDARLVVAECHAGEPDALRLEEEIVWLAVRDGARAASGIEARLRRALKTMATMPERAMEVARWADRALPSFPETVLEAESANLLALGSAARLERTTRVSGILRWQRISGSVSWIIPAASRRGLRKIGVRLHPGALGIVPPDALLAAPIAVAGAADVIEARWTAANGAVVSRSLPSMPGRPLPIDADVRQVELRTPGGGWFRLSALPAEASIHFTPELERTLGDWPLDLTRVLTESLQHLAQRPLDGVQVGTRFLYRDPDHRCDVHYRFSDRSGSPPPIEIIKVSRVTPNVFLSYSRVDAERIGGLISRISSRGSRISTDKDSIEPGDRWRDKLEDRLIDELASATTFGVIASPSYLASEFASQELRWILRLNYAGYARVVPMALDLRGLELPDEIRRLHVVDVSTPEGVERAVLAFRAASMEDAPQANATVSLLAQTDDLLDYREGLRRELEGRGYRVVSLPGDEPRPVLSVRLIGRYYREEVETEVLSALRDIPPGAHLILWIAPSSEMDTRQQQLMRRLEYEVPAGVDVLRTSFTELKAHVLDVLGRSRDRSTAQRQAHDRPILVVACERNDRKDVASIARQLADRLDVRIGAWSEPGAARRDLATADGVLIYWGAGTAEWLQATLRLVSRTAGSKPVAVFMAPPLTLDKQRGELSIPVFSDEGLAGETYGRGAYGQSAYGSRTFGGPEFAQFIDTLGGRNS